MGNNGDGEKWRWGEMGMGRNMGRNMGEKDRWGRWGEVSTFDLKQLFITVLAPAHSHTLILGFSRILIWRIVENFILEF